MRKSILGLSAFALLASAAPAFAQDEEPASPITISGSAAVVSDYRFRGFSQTQQDAAIQGGITAAHESGFYLGTWGSSLNFPGSDLGTELDIFAGYSTSLSDAISVDVGLLYYLYPKHKSITGDINTDFFEPYINLTGTFGPVSLKVGANYAWSQSALASLVDEDGSKSSAIYLHAEPSVSIPGTPIGLNGHLGYAKSDAFPGGVDGKVWDWSLGATVGWKMLTFGVSYVDTDEPSEIRGSDSAVVFSLTAAF